MLIYCKNKNYFLFYYQMYSSKTSDADIKLTAVDFYIKHLV